MTQYMDVIQQLHLIYYRLSLPNKNEAKHVLAASCHNLGVMFRFKNKRIPSFIFSEWEMHISSNIILHYILHYVQGALYLALCISVVQNILVVPFWFLIFLFMHMVNNSWQYASLFVLFWMCWKVHLNNVSVYPTTWSYWGIKMCWQSHDKI